MACAVAEKERGRGGKRRGEREKKTLEKEERKREKRAEVGSGEDGESRGVALQPARFAYIPTKASFACHLLHHLPFRLLLLRSLASRPPSSLSLLLFSLSLSPSHSLKNALARERCTVARLCTLRPLHNHYNYRDREREQARGTRAAVRSFAAQRRRWRSKGKENAGPVRETERKKRGKGVANSGAR